MDFAGVFYDYESGLGKEKCNGLDAMLQKAYRGEIDYIITKPISRLSRNRLDTLTILFLECLSDHQVIQRLPYASRFKLFLEA